MELFDVKCFSFLCVLFAFCFGILALFPVFALLDLQFHLPAGSNVLEAIL